MNTAHPNIVRILSLATLMVILASCQTVDMTSRAPTQMEYVVVEFRRFVSGVYVNELANKYVQVDCRFSSTMAGTLPGGLSPNRYMSFMAIAPSVQESPESLNVVVPKDIADIVFSLKHGDNIRVKGRALEVTSQRRSGGPIFKSLVLQANLIEKLQ